MAGKDAKGKQIDTKSPLSATQQAIWNNKVKTNLENPLNKKYNLGRVDTPDEEKRNNPGRDDTVVEAKENEANAGNSSKPKSGTGDSQLNKEQVSTAPNPLKTTFSPFSRGSGG
ncbi:MAG: hypothetical protein NXI01_07655 [Gammaproteobacteria bacterium]|nr:hypothetical protein [Gammaproteobacteria bacterium]